MNSFKGKPIYLAAALALLLMPAFAAALNTQLDNSIAWAPAILSRETLWISYGLIFVGAFLWQDHVSGFARPRLSRVDTLLLLGLFALSFVLSQYVAPVPKVAQYRTFLLVLVVAVGYSAYSFSAKAPRGFSRAMYFAFIAGALLHIPFIMLQIYVWQGVEDFVWSIGIPGWRGVRPYNYSVEVAIAVGVGLLALGAKGQRKTQVLLLTSVSICWMLLFWGGGRGAAVGLIASLVFSSILFPAYAKKMWLTALLTAALGASLSLLIWTPDSPSFGLLAMISRSTSDSGSSGRMEMWRYAWDSIKQNPFFGYGLQQFMFLPSPSVSVPINIPPHVHNIVLEVLLSWGAVGAAVFTALFARISGRVLRRLRSISGEEKLPALLPLAALLGHSSFSGTYYHIHSLIYLAIFFGICLAPNPAQNENTNG